MTSKNIFDWIWRINSILLLVIFTALLIFISIQLAENIFMTKNSNPVITNVAEDPKGNENWIIGYAQKIRGSDYIALPLISERKEVNLGSTRVMDRPDYSYSSRSSPSKNILFIKGRENESNWLFKNNDQIIQRYEQYPHENRLLDKLVVTKAIFYEVISIDSNHDGVLDSKDKTSLAISDFDGENFTIIIESTDRIISKSPLDEDTIVIVYQNNGKGYSLLYTVSSRKSINVNELPKV